MMVVARNRGRGEWLVFLPQGAFMACDWSFWRIAASKFIVAGAGVAGGELWRPGVKINGGRKFSEIKV